MRGTVLASLLALAGCSTVEWLGRRELKKTPERREALEQVDYYVKWAKRFRRFHDDKRLDEKVLLKAFQDVFRFGPDPRLPQAYKGGWRWPLDEGVVSSEFGPRWGKEHHGMDLAARMDTPVYAAGPGIVAYSDDKLRGYGNVVIVRHDRRITTIYAHNKYNLVKKGQRVKAGQEIAKLGSTGRSTGPHLHFEVRRYQKPLNPRKKLPKPNFQ